MDVDPKYMNIVTLYGREYQKYSIDNDIHFMPVDEEMAEHLEQLHDLFNIVLDNKLFSPTLATIDRVLDLGYGAADWAIQVAKAYPQAEVIGLDISCHMLPDELPDNFHPQICDLNRSLPPFPTSSFSLIQLRCLAAGINASRWPSLLSDLYRLLKPGGCIQCLEFYHNIQSYNGSFTDQHALYRWSQRYLRSIDTIKNPRIPMALPTELEKAGYVNVETKMITVPLCAWFSPGMKGEGEEEGFRRRGEKMGDILEGLLRGVSLLPFMKRTLMQEEEFEGLIRDCIDEAGQEGLKAYLPLYLVVGRKGDS